MPAIHMVDLPSQYLRLKDQIDTAIDKVLLSGTYIKGPEVADFERRLAEYTGARHVIGCGNGTDALMLAFLALDLPFGAEVITPSFSYAAVAETLLFLGLKPVYAEVNPQTFLLNASGIDALVTENTVGIVPVHLFGQCCDMEPILELAEHYNLFVVEDNAQAIGCQYTFSNGDIKQAGTMGTIGTTSFFPTKNLGCYGDGGAIFCNDDELADRIRMLANHGQKVKYNHEILGVNSRLDTIQAAILNVKLNHLDEFTKQRQQAAAAYDRELMGINGLNIPLRSANSSHVFHQYTLTTTDRATRDGLKEFLNSMGIPSMVYYPLPLHVQKAYEQPISMELTENLSQTVLSLPMHTEISAEQTEYITHTIKAYYKI